MRNLYLAALLGALPSLGCAASTLTITVVNELPLARADETIELSARDLSALAADDLAKIHVTDATGKELLTQAVDSDFFVHGLWTERFSSRPAGTVPMWVMSRRTACWVRWRSAAAGVGAAR